MGYDVEGTGVRRGKSLTLVVCLYHYRAALEHELRSRYGWGGDEIVSGRQPWNLATMLVGEIVREPYSHLSAAINEWAYVPDPMDVFFCNWIDAQAQMHHKSGKVLPKPAERPWTRKTDDREVMPDPARAERRSALMARLGLGGVVYADDEPDGEPEPESDD